MIYVTNGITWAEFQYFLIFFPFSVVAIILLAYRFYWQKRAALSLSNYESSFKLLQNFSITKKSLKVILLSIGIICLVLALARPQWDSHDEVIKQEGRDIIIALDISRSMLAQDIKPSRLEFAKEKIKKLVNSLGSDRVGLILFSGEPFFQCPLTVDKTAFFNFLDAVTAESLSSGTTDLGKAIEKAVSIYKNMPSKKNKLLAIFTDGEDFSSNLAQVKQKAQEIGLHLFTFGIGTPQGAPVPVLDNEGGITGHQKDEQGNIVISRLNEPLLKSLAQASGARYVRMAENDRDIALLVESVKQFEKEKFEDKRFLSLQDKYYYFGIISLICLLLEWLL